MFPHQNDPMIHLNSSVILWATLSTEPTQLPYLKSIRLYRLPLFSGLQWELNVTKMFNWSRRRDLTFEHCAPDWSHMPWAMVRGPLNIRLVFLVDLRLSSMWKTKWREKKMYASFNHKPVAEDLKMMIVSECGPVMLWEKKKGHEVWRYCGQVNIKKIT